MTNIQQGVGERALHLHAHSSRREKERSLTTFCLEITEMTEIISFKLERFENYCPELNYVSAFCVQLRWLVGSFVRSFFGFLVYSFAVELHFWLSLIRLFSAM